MNTPISSHKTGILGGVLLITGCCIGAGMLGLPVISATAGFIPSSVAMLVCCFFMMSSGLLVLEATLWFEHEVNMLSIVGFALGKCGKIATWILFLFLFYSLLIAYTAGSGELFSDFLTKLFNQPVSNQMGSLLCTFVIGSLVYAGTRAVDQLNRLFMLGLILSYCLLIGIGASSINAERLLQQQWKASIVTFPVMLVSFGFQNLVPSLTFYLKRNIPALRLTIIIGSLIPFFIYLVWEALILGLLPKNDDPQFAEILHKSDMATTLLKSITGHPWILICANYFSFFAIMTSFITTALSCIDFLADGLHVRKTTRARGLLSGLVLLPPLFFALYYPHIFLKALGYAGGFASVILFGFFPALIIWIGRYKMKLQKFHLVPGGKFFLITILLLSSLFFTIEVMQQINF